MTHPKLPPCPWFGIHSIPGDDDEPDYHGAVWIARDPNQDTLQGSKWGLVPIDPLPKYHAWKRPILAAVAEVEWRKRAARWCKLRDGVFDKWLLMQERAPDESWVEEHWLYGLSQCAENKCYEIAKEWRAWGEGK